MCLEEGSRLFHTRLQLDPVSVAAETDLGKAGIERIAGAHIHDVRSRNTTIDQGLDLVAGGMTKLDPADIAGARANTRGLCPLGDIQGTGGQVATLVGYKHEQAAVGRIVTHQHSTLIGHDLYQFVGNAAKAVVLLDAAGAITIDSNFRQVTIVVGVGGVLIAEQILAEGLETGVAGRCSRIRLILFTRQVRVPG